MKVIFWDFHATLTLPERQWSKLLYDSIICHKHNVTMEEIRNHLRTGFTWDTPEIAYAESTGDKWWDNLFVHFDSFYEKHDISKADSEIINDYYKKQIIDSKNYTLYDDTLATLRACIAMGYKNYVLSNNFPELGAVVAGMGMSEYFLDCIVSGNVGYEKPRKEIFQHALQVAGFPDVCYMVGDNPIADIQGGKSVGMKTILVHNDTICGADYTCKNLSDIPLLLT